jgi:hypothetical protein
MPVEIRELVVKVTLEETKTKKMDSHELQELKNKIVKECTERIMAKLETISER